MLLRSRYEPNLDFKLDENTKIAFMDQEVSKFIGNRTVEEILSVNVINKGQYFLNEAVKRKHLMETLFRKLDTTSEMPYLFPTYKFLGTNAFSIAVNDLDKRWIVEKLI